MRGLHSFVITIAFFFFCCFCFQTFRWFISFHRWQFSMWNRKRNRNQIKQFQSAKFGENLFWVFWFWCQWTLIDKIYFTYKFEFVSVCAIDAFHIVIWLIFSCEINNNIFKKSKFVMHLCCRVRSTLYNTTDSNHSLARCMYAMMRVMKHIKNIYEWFVQVYSLMFIYINKNISNGLIWHDTLTAPKINLYKRIFVAASST